MDILNKFVIVIFSHVHSLNQFKTEHIYTESNQMVNESDSSVPEDLTWYGR